MLLSNVPLNALRAFDALVRTRSLAEAARELQMMPSAISQQIDMLEESLGVSLFVSQGQKLVLTPSGEKLRKQVMPFFEEIQEGISSVISQTQNISGLLRVGVAKELGASLISSWLFAFQKTYPRVNFELSLVSQPNFLRLFQEDKLDCAVGFHAKPEENLQSTRVLKQQALILSNRRSTLDFERHRDQTPIIYRENDPLMSAYLQSCFKRVHAFKDQANSSANPYEVLCHFLELNPDHWGVLPELSDAVQDALKKKRLKVIHSLSVGLDLYFFRLDQKRPPRRLKVFEDWLKEEPKLANAASF